MGSQLCLREGHTEHVTHVGYANGESVCGSQCRYKFHYGEPYGEGLVPGKYLEFRTLAEEVRELMMYVWEKYPRAVLLINCGVLEIPLPPEDLEQDVAADPRIRQLVSI